MFLDDDRKRGQVRMGAGQLAFNDPEMVRAITTGFSVARCKVEANRLIARAAEVKLKYDDLKKESDESDESNVMSDEDAAAIVEGRKAEELLYLIEKELD